MSGRERLAEILDAYGADPDRWPADERAAALALLREDAGARVLRERALRLDRVLTAADEVDVPPDLAARVLAAAPLPAAARAQRRRPSIERGGRRLRYLAAAVPMAAAAVVALWLARAPENEVTLSDAIAALGEYETPGDELLTTGEVDLFSDPWVDCPESVLGCIDVEIEAGEPRSDVAGRGRNRA
jgi:hypothetical protein